MLATFSVLLLPLGYVVYLPCTMILLAFCLYCVTLHGVWIDYGLIYM
jgi:hypothetical protein